jgi:hypothetical protein
MPRRSTTSAYRGLALSLLLLVPAALAVGQEIRLSAQGIPMTSNADVALVLKELERLQPGQDLKVTVLRDEKIVELSMKWVAW